MTLYLLEREKERDPIRQGLVEWTRIMYLSSFLKLEKLRGFGEFWVSPSRGRDSIVNGLDYVSKIFL